MQILVFNAGSSSLKFGMFSVGTETREVFKGSYERFRGGIRHPGPPTAHHHPVRDISLPRLSPHSGRLVIAPSRGRLWWAASQARPPIYETRDLRCRKNQLPDDQDRDGGIGQHLGSLAPKQNLPYAAAAMRR